MFVGRHEELHQLAVASARSPVVLVGGEPGIGKSALVERFLATNASDEGRDAIAVRARSIEDLARQLTAGLGGEEPPREPEAAAAYLVELVGDLDRPLVLEDAHTFELASELSLLVDAFARWAHPRAGLVVVGRGRMSAPHLAEQIVWLGAMPQEDIVRLLRGCRPATSEEDLARFAEASLGSPMLARQLALGGRGDARARLAALTDEALAIARVLATMAAPLPGSCFRGHASALHALRTHALLDEREDAVTLTAVARAVIPTDPRPPVPLLEEVLAHLASLGELADARQRIELASASGVESIVATELARADESLVDIVGGVRLAHLLSGFEGSEALRWRLLAVARAPTEDGLRWLAALETPVEPRARLAHARALGATGNRARASLVYDGLARSSDAECALEAALGRVRVSAPEELQSVRAQLMDLGGLSEEDELRRDVYAALIDHRIGEEARGRRLARRVHVRLHRATNRRALVARELFAAFAYLRLHADARRLEAEERLALPFSADRLFNVACVAVESADRTRTREVFERWDRVTGGAPRYRFLRAFIELRAGTWVEGPRTTERIAELLHMAEAHDDADYLQSARICALEHSVRAGLAPTVEDPLDVEVTAWRTLALMRLDGEPREAPHADTDRIAPLLRAEQAALSSSARGLDEAANMLLEALHEAERRASALEAGDYLDALASVLLRTARPEVSHVRACTDAADRLASAHGLVELSLFGRGLELLTRVGASTDTPTKATLLEVAASSSHVVARVARALAQGRKLVTASDQAALRSTRARTTTEPAAARRIDHRAHTVSFAEGRTLDLSKHALLFRLVDVLSSAPAGLTKEELARAVWGVRTYAPERDDKRIQVAVNRLRGIFAKQNLASRVVTTATGYAWSHT